MSVNLCPPGAVRELTIRRGESYSNFAICRQSTGSRVDTLQPFPASSLRDSVLPALRRAILDGRLAAGTRLSENEISRSMHVSRSPVREAIAQLEKEGLAERYPNRGAFVADVYSGRAISELASVRSILECFAITQAAFAVQTETLEPLRVATFEMHEAAIRREHAKIGEADFRFHQALVSLAGNRTLLQTWRGIASHYWEIYLPRIQALERDIDHWGRNHRLIVDAMAEGRFDLATMYLQFNILNSAEQLRALLPDEPDPARNVQERSIDAIYPVLEANLDGK
jgi:DNA-binding GntR family transcriptional regulator